MTSLDHDFKEHEHENDGQVNAALSTASDNDWDCWEADNWGDMEQQSTTAINTNSPSTGVGSKANNEQWASLEEEPVSFF